jgi:hypothetical protein
MNRSIAILLVALSACAAPAAQNSSAADLAALRKDVDALRDQVDGLSNQLGHLQSNVDATSADNEFTELAIDAVIWDDASAAYQWPRQTGRDALMERYVLAAMGQSHNHGLARQFESSRPPALLCHPTEWRGWGKLIRFTRLADPVVYLEAEGHPSVEGRIQSGGICNSEGSIRFVFLDLDRAVEPGVGYHVRPRNENEHYRWIVGDGVVVAAP